MQQELLRYYSNATKDLTCHNILEDKCTPNILFENMLEKCTSMVTQLKREYSKPQVKDV
jgi:hypothetical protein